MYGSSCDIWSLGCVMAELVLKKPLFLPTLINKPSLEDMTAQIFDLIRAKVDCGKYSNNLVGLRELERGGGDFKCMIESILKFNPKSRPTPSEVLSHPFFLAGGNF